MASSTLDDGGLQPGTRAEMAAERIRDLSQRQEPGARLGSRMELRELCGVSVGTFNESLRILQSTGEVTVRPGPGGGVFAAGRSAFARLSRSVQDLARLQPDLRDITRIVRALDPLIVRDAAQTINDAQRTELRRLLRELETSRDGELRAVLLGSLEVYSTIVSVGSDPLLTAIAGTLLKAQIRVIQSVIGPASPRWTSAVDRHIAGVTALVEAIVAGDTQAAVAVRTDHDLVELFDLALADGDAP